MSIAPDKLAQNSTPALMHLLASATTTALAPLRHSGMGFFELHMSCKVRYAPIAPAPYFTKDEAGRDDALDVLMPRATVAPPAQVSSTRANFGLH